MKEKQIFLYSKPIMYLYICYINIVAILYNYFKSFFTKFSIDTIKLDETQIYIEKQTKHFLQIFPYKTEEDRKKWNINIDDRCYSLESFQELIKDEMNELEPEWQRRLLIENTPRGNIIMYYDIYKQAFAYASDQHMNYPILNACAMKYVQTFRCVDFFLDGNILPEGIVSPFVLLQEEMEIKEKEKQSDKKKDLGIQFKDAPFAKLKTYKLTELVNEKKIKVDKQSESTKIQPNNIFRYLGKTTNLSLLHKPKIVAFKNPLISCPVESFDYLYYKNQFKKQKEEEKEYIYDTKVEYKEDENDILELDIEYDSTSTLE
jgi:hypothetical protein